MSFEAFVGLWLFSFFLAYCVLIVFNGLREVFPSDYAGIKIDFKNRD